MSENLRKGSVQYKLLEKQKVYIAYNQILYPQVLMSPDLKLSMVDYQWLYEIGLTMTGRF